MSNNININTNIKTNAKRPADAKVIVGPGQTYLTLSEIPQPYRYNGMRVLDKNDNIEYEWVVGGGGGFVAGTWKNISFGVVPFIYRGNNNLWLNSTSNNISVTQEEPILFDAITFGKISKITWVISKSGSPIRTINKESFQHNFTALGLHNITLTVWDEFNNQVSVTNLKITVSSIGMLIIQELTVLPYQGLTPNTNTKTLNFNAVINNLEISALDYIKMYSGVGNFNNETTLYENNVWVSGVTYENGNLFIDGQNFTHFNGTFSNTTQFKLKVQYYSSTNDEEIVTYSAIPKIDIAAPTINYNYHTQTLTSTVTLVADYDTASTVIGVLKDSSNNTVGTYNATSLSTFTLTVPNQTFTPGQYNYTTSFTQTLPTGVGNEVHTVNETMTLTVAEPTYTVNINVKDNHDPNFSYLSGVVVTLGTQTATTATDGNVTFTVASGSYDLNYTKANFIKEPGNVVSNVEVSGDNLNINLTMQAEVEIDTLNISPVVPDETGYVTYSLLPDNKYEDTSTLTYDIGGEVVTKTLDSPGFNEFDFTSDHAGLTLTLTLNTMYKTSQDEETITKVVGEAPIYSTFFVWDSANPATQLEGQPFTDLFTTYLPVDSLSDVDNIKPNVGTLSEPTIEYSPLKYGSLSGWCWMAFPKDIYPNDFTLTRFGDFGTFEAIGGFCFSSDISINSNDYKFYIAKGTNLPDVTTDFNMDHAHFSTMNFK